MKILSLNNLIKKFENGCCTYYFEKDVDSYTKTIEEQHKICKYLVNLNYFYLSNKKKVKLKEIIENNFYTYELIYIDENIIK